MKAVAARHQRSHLKQVAPRRLAGLPSASRSGSGSRAPRHVPARDSGSGRSAGPFSWRGLTDLSERGRSLLYGGRRGAGEGVASNW